MKRSITEYFVGLGLIWRSKNRSRDELFFESFECHITIRRPVVVDILLQQVGERLGNLGEVLNEPSAIASKTKEASELLDVLRGFPVDNRFNFLGGLTAIPSAEMIWPRYKTLSSQNSHLENWA